MNFPVLSPRFMIIERRGDQSEALGTVYIRVGDAIETVARRTGLPPSAFTPTLVAIRCQDLRVNAFRLDYETFQSGGGDRQTEYYLATVSEAGPVLAALYRRQQGEITITPRREPVRRNPR